MKEIKLSRGMVTSIDDIDYPRVSQFKWFAVPNVTRERTTYYAARHSPRNGGAGPLIYMHRYILNEKRQVDHKDGDGLHNWRQNLRPATNSQNSQNRRKQLGTSSRFKGVCWNRSKGKWRANIWLNKKQYFLGYFSNEKDAALVYDTAARSMFGEFAKTNF